MFDARNSRVTLRSRPDLNIDSVGQAVRKTQTMRAFLVAKGEQGEETLKPIGETGATEDEGIQVISHLNFCSHFFKSFSVDRSTPLPDYLPEDDLPEEKSDKAVAPHGITETATNWISSAATFLQRSFYW